MSGRGKKWTPEEDEYIRAHYPGESFEEIGAALGRSPGGVQDRTYRLGVYARKWTEEEKIFLGDKWGNVSIPTIAKQMGRSVEAVKLMAARMGLGRHIHGGDMLTFSQFVQAIGSAGSYAWLRQKFEKNGFPFHRKKSINKSFLMVSVDEWWKWAEQHKEILDFANFEEYALGAEPAWAKEKRRLDIAEPKRNAREWTGQEDERLKYLLRRFEFSLDQIAADLQRREGAVRRRIATLGLKERPVRNPGKKWQQDEIDTMIQMHKAGHSWESIGAKLGRTASACRGRYERVLNPDLTKQAVLQNKRALREFFQAKQCTHYTPAHGCDIGGMNCDECNFYQFRDKAKEHATGWISTKAGTDGQARIVSGE